MIDTLIEYDNGGKIEAYQMVDKSTNDFMKVFACCDFFARKGAKTLITPRFSETVGNPDYAIIYASLRDTQYWGKCPDFCVDGVWYEHEGYDVTKNLSNLHKRADTFSKMMNRGLKQSDRIIIEDCGVTQNYIRRNLYNRIHYEKQNISAVYVRTPESLELIYKK